MNEQRPSKEEVIRWLHRINKQGGLGFDAHAALDNALLYLRGEPAKPSKEQNTEALAWSLQAHEDLAKMLADGGGNMLHVRANRALGILFAEVERLEKILYPIGTAHEPPARRRPTLEESNAWTSAEEERDWWRAYAMEIEQRAPSPPSGLRDQMWAYLDAIGAPRDGLAKQSINAFLMWMEDRTSETKSEMPAAARRDDRGFTQEEWSAMPCASLLHHIDDFHVPGTPCPMALRTSAETSAGTWTCARCSAVNAQYTDCNTCGAPRAAASEGESR